MIFLIISIAVLNSAAFLMPKRISRLEIYASSLFALSIEYIADYVFDFILNLYGYFKFGVDLLSFIAVLGIYPAVNIIFLNYYPYKGKVLGKLIYILGYSLLSLFYEWLSFKSKYFYHNGWKFWMSLISYPIIFGIIALNFKLIRKLGRQEC